MKIIDIEALHLRIPQVELKADGTQEVLLVQVTTNEGLVGYGEAISNASVARAIVEAPRSMPFRHGLAAVLRGADPLDPEAAGRTCTMRLDGTVAAARRFTQSRQWTR